jgi:eukaryotic-like serine/threonine-protein kinase
VSERHLGQTLGKYRIEELIGSGGFAWVYKAFDPELEIHVALKVLKPQFAGDETFEQRFRREAATAAKLRHPNIIKIYSVGRDAEAVYFAMDYYPSGLAERLEVSNVLPEEFVVRVGVDVAQALGYAHREGVIHRDIKVDNILFDAHGNAVVADFGIARALSGYSNQTGTNMVVGTPQYFAPEQARAKQLDGRADIYSLGVTLYRAATGRLPFEGDDWYEIARQHVEEPPPPPRSINPDLSPAFEAAILHCMQKQADDRPATGELLAQELVTLLPATLETSAYRTRFTSTEPTVIVRSGSQTVITPNEPPPAKSRSGAFWVGGVALVAGLAVTLALFTKSRDAESAGPPVRVPDSTVAVSPPPASPPLSPPTGVDSTARKDSAPKPVRTRFAMQVEAPADAIISVNGVESKGGIWRNDSLPVGTYQVAATVPAPAGCRTATQSRSVTVRARPGLQKFSLSPRSCGIVSFDARPNRGIRYELLSLTPNDSVPVVSGVVPAQGLVLPTGDYLRKLRAPKCADYGDTISVTAGGTTRPRPQSLICP